MPGLATILNGHFISKRRLFSFFLILQGIQPIFGQTHSFSGTIGKYPVYLQFTQKGSEVTGTYFYKSKLIDIPLSGSLKAGVITLKSLDLSGEIAENPESFRFKWPAKTAEGTWSYNGKSSTFKLKALTSQETGSSKLSNPYIQKERSDATTLTQVKIGLFRLKETDSVKTINHIRIRQFEETHTGISLFRIDSGLVASKQTDANYYLEYLHISEFLEALNCASYSPGASDFSYNVSDIGLSDDLISFNVFCTYFCGGAHPNEDNYGVNYNLSTKERVSPSDFIVPNKEDAFDERVYSYLEKMNPELFDVNEQTVSDNVYTDCEYYKKELWQISSCDFVLTSEGLKLLPSFPHFAAFCMDPEWAVVPYSELKDLIKPAFYSNLKQLKR